MFIVVARCLEDDVIVGGYDDLDDARQRASEVKDKLDAEDWDWIDSYLVDLSIDVSEIVCLNIVEVSRSQVKNHAKERLFPHREGNWVNPAFAH